jgi:hypothetical protein
MLKSQQHFTNPGGFDSHALPPFLFISSGTCQPENHAKTHLGRKIKELPRSFTGVERIEE